MESRVSHNGAFQDQNCSYSIILKSMLHTVLHKQSSSQRENYISIQNNNQISSACKSRNSFYKTQSETKNINARKNTKTKEQLWRMGQSIHPKYKEMDQSYMEGGRLLTLLGNGRSRNIWHILKENRKTKDAGTVVKQISAKHTIFLCPKWQSIRITLKRKKKRKDMCKRSIRQEIFRSIVLANSYSSKDCELWL